ncbi:MAG: serine/threonine protein phosphatase [Eggerthellaceae bacterium]|nr:serine/threonine protein phosphatase [Eggerthellaceae bacterium]
MSTYAISDIHGCFDAFEEALRIVDFSSKDELYILGDVVDRGPKVGECIEWLVSHDANGKGSNIHFIMGNHEEMADWSFIGAWSDFRFDEVCVHDWKHNGGRATIKQMRNLDPSIVDAFQRIVKKAPKALCLEMLDKFVIMSHAGLRPAEPESEPAEWLIQAEQDLLWIGVGWYRSSAEAPFPVVSGHTPTVALCNHLPSYICPEEVLEEGRNAHMMHWGSKHCIDCGCVYGFNLGILRLDDWQAFYVNHM